MLMRFATIFGLSFFLSISAFGAGTGAGDQNPQPGGGDSAIKINSLRELSASMESLSGSVGRSVVQVFSSGYNLGAEEHNATALLSAQRATGSGVIVSADGYIITNAHVVQGARRVRVRLSDLIPAPGDGKRKAPRRLLDAQVLGSDRDIDLALIKIDASDLPFLTWGDSSKLKQGQLVLAFGNPLGLDNSVSMGIISSVDRQLNPDNPMVYIQTDAAINPGNSGGPLVDTDGHVVGINTFIFTQSGGSEGIGFAIPSNLVKSIYEQIRTEGHIHHHRIGVLARSITPALAFGLNLPQEDGVLIEDVVPQSPADIAGLHVGDVILKIGNMEIENIRQFALGIFQFSVGENAMFEVLRGGEKVALEIPVIEANDDPERFLDRVDPARDAIDQLGIVGLTITGDMTQALPQLRRARGVVIAGKITDIPFVGDKPQAGDVIYTVNGKSVESVQDIRDRLAQLSPDDPIVLQVERNSQLSFLVLERDIF